MLLSVGESWLGPDYESAALSDNRDQEAASLRFAAEQPAGRGAMRLIGPQGPIGATQRHTVQH